MLVTPGGDSGSGAVDDVPWRRERPAEGEVPALTARAALPYATLNTGSGGVFLHSRLCNQLNRLFVSTCVSPSAGP
jgi:hypothetical protein